jgi:hypothetical protein
MLALALAKSSRKLLSLRGDFVLDGELVVFDSQGRPSFQLLQNNRSSALPVYFRCGEPLCGSSPSTVGGNLGQWEKRSGGEHPEEDSL